MKNQPKRQAPKKAEQTPYSKARTRGKVLLKIYRRFSRDESINYLMKEIEDMAAAHRAQVSKLQVEITVLNHTIKEKDYDLSLIRGKGVYTQEEAYKEIIKRVHTQGETNKELRRKLTETNNELFNALAKLRKYETTDNLQVPTMPSTQSES